MVDDATVAGGAHAWIFVSHSSRDLPRVREVRNHLERRGASPLLFHLRALSDPDRFWPLIEEEIAARNFFLYCNSDSARTSEWVRRERDHVALIGARRAIRVGEVRVDEGTLDTSALDRFLFTTRVFLSRATGDELRVRPFSEELRRAGFTVFDAAEPGLGSLSADTISLELSALDADGWFVVFVSRGAATSPFLVDELATARTLGPRIVPVLLDDVDHLDAVADLQAFDARWEPGTAPQRFVEHLLSREVPPTLQI